MTSLGRMLPYMYPCVFWLAMNCVINGQYVIVTSVLGNPLNVQYINGFSISGWADVKLAFGKDASPCFP